MTRRRRAVIFGMIAVVVAGILGGKALADSSSQVASFRTATVQRATVTQIEQGSGVIEPVAQGTVAFPISGTITGVAVQPGQQVTAGQTLATLDTSGLRAQLTAQQAQLAAAQLTLSNALNGSTPSNTSSAARASTTTTPTSAARSSTSSNTSPLDDARQGVASGQQRVDSALSTAKTALGGARSSCATPSTSSGAAPPTTSTTSSSTSTSTTTTAPQQSGASQQCIDALQASLNAQQQVASAQSSLAQAESKLDALLANASSSSASSPQAATRSSGATSTPSVSGPTSAELVADQAAVDAAQANVTAAQQSLAQATIVSPLDGTVAAVNMKAGDHVGAASSTENVIVVGPGGYEVTTMVPVTDIGNVKLGDDATVAPDGSRSSLAGKVVSIGVVPTTSGSNTLYAVIIGLSGSPDGLRNGSDASVAITLNQAADALAVPTSALRGAGGGALRIVTVVSGSKTSTVPVQVGAVGPDLTEIKSGLQEGQHVMLADLNTPLPSNTTTGRGLGGGGGGGLGGAGAFGGATIGRGG